MTYILYRITPTFPADPELLRSINNLHLAAKALTSKRRHIFHPRDGKKREQEMGNSALELVNFFRGDVHGTELLIRTLHGRLTAMRRRFTRLLAKMEHVHLDVSGLLASYGRLSAAEQSAVLISADFFNIWQAASVDTPLNQLAKANRELQALLSTQDLAAGRAPSFPETIGHHDKLWLPHGNGHLSLECGAWAHVPGNVIGGCITIDFDSPMAVASVATSGVLSRPARVGSEIERQTVVSKLDQALQSVSEAFPAWGTMIRTFVARIVIRFTRESSEPQPGGIASEHATSAPGIIRFADVHTTAWTPAVCAERILHEAMHNFLACWEDTNGSFCANSPLYRAVSPWTGNQIPNTSLVHAAFIYYACYQMFTRFQASGPSPQRNDPSLASLRERFAMGFHVAPVLEDQLGLEDPPRQDVCTALAAMKADVIERHGKGVGDRLQGDEQPGIVVLYSDAVDPVVLDLRREAPEDMRYIHIDDLIEASGPATTSGLSKHLLRALAADVQGRVVLNRLFKLDGTRTESRCTERKVDVAWVHVDLLPVLHRAGRLIHDPGPDGVSRSRLPLNLQWLLLRKRGIRTPDFKFGVGETAINARDFRDPVRVDSRALDRWPTDFRLQSVNGPNAFVVDVPAGTPLIVQYSGSGRCTTPTPLMGDAVEAEMGRIIAACRTSFKSEVGEIRMYIGDQSEVLFYSFNPVLSTTFRTDTFLRSLEAQEANPPSEHAYA
ncbi:hypothetical protein L2Y94_08925 [Luteibacter aegosomatis]|uniref:hypothetical protein n=1 Tax=Luteibacter aegosomatis TaxID=2911537 RepID=UPI001FFB4EF5|nr:hypothetical protein [Luteibacter aegosomatis]UPG87457.1 hypothetical protein L2Y94_08925 [Luteibacter aegosomatis]